MNTPWCDNSQAEIVGNGMGGFCVNTTSHFLDCMKKLYQDPALRKEMGKKGRFHVLEKYEYRTVAARSVKLLREAVSVEQQGNLPPFEKLKLEGIKYNVLVRMLLLSKLKFFGRYAHGSTAHRSINFVIRMLSRYKLRRNF
jgi:hypothetical protein